MTPVFRLLPFLLASFLLFLPPSLWAQDGEFRLLIRNHRFEPVKLKLPAHKKVKLLVINEDETPEEFESHDLNREKVVMGKSQIVVYIGPLKPGNYKFFGDFNLKTAQGEIIVQ